MGKCDADSGVLFSACLPVSQSLRSDARCCDAGSRVVSPACPCVSQSLSDATPACLPVSASLCGQMPDTVTPAPGGVSRLPPCLPVSAVRCQMLWRVSRLSSCVSQGLCSQTPHAVTLAPGWCLRLCGQMPDAVTPARVSRLSPCLPVSPFKGQML